MNLLSGYRTYIVTGGGQDFVRMYSDATYGIPTGLPWALDFGDGVPRHPTQLYDMVFLFTFGGLLLAKRQRWRDRCGLLFKLYLSGYLLWRLCVDAIKPVPFDYGAGLSGIQLVCIAALLCYLPLLARQMRAPSTLHPDRP